jgi:hypothetical protein
LSPGTSWRGRVRGLSQYWPLPRPDYIADFESQQSREQFLGLLGEAESVIELPPRDRRSEAY